MIVDLIWEDGECIMPIPDEIMEEMGLEIGDELEFIDNKNGTITLRKKEQWKA